MGEIYQGTYRVLAKRAEEKRTPLRILILRADKKEPVSCPDNILRWERFQAVPNFFQVRRVRADGLLNEEK